MFAAHGSGDLYWHLVYLENPHRRESSLGATDWVGIVGLTENPAPLVLLSTTITLSDNRRSIPYDQSSASLTHFLGQLSKVIGTDAEIPEDLPSLP